MSVFWEVCRWTGLFALLTAFGVTGAALLALAERHVERAAFKRDARRETARLIREMERAQ